MIDPDPEFANPPTEPCLTEAARMLRDGLWIEQVTPAEAAQASERTVKWIEGVLDGTVHPTLDELELTLNAIGLEMRIHPYPADEKCHIRHAPGVIATKIQHYREVDLRVDGETIIQRSPPQPGVTRRQFSAGPKRQDGGGSAAILTALCLGSTISTRVSITPKKFARKAKISQTQLDELLSGDWTPTSVQFEKMLARNGIALHYRLEPYEYHDDELHYLWKMQQKEKANIVS